MTTDSAAILDALRADPRYRRNLGHGRPRPGHPEGSIAAHVAELECNLESLRPRLSADEAAKLRLLIHVHDTFKAEARVGVTIDHPDSHASLARRFLAEFCDDADLLAMVQRHDVPFALWRQRQTRGEYDRARLDRLLDEIDDWDLFLAFQIVDGCTAGKSRAPLEWFFAEIAGWVESRFTAADILPSEADGDGSSSVEENEAGP